jgi:hypothetical protein
VCDALKKIGLTPHAKLTRLYEQIRNGDPQLELRNGAPMSLTDPTLDETPIAAEAQDSPPADDETESAAGPAAGPATRSREKKPEPESGPGQLFGNNYQSGPNNQIYQAYHQTFHENPEAT